MEIRSALDGRIVNNGVERYRDLNHMHLSRLETGQPAEDTVFLKMETNQSELRVAQAARTQAFSEGKALAAERRTLQETGFVAQLFEIPIEVNGRSPSKRLSASTPRGIRPFPNAAWRPAAQSGRPKPSTSAAEPRLKSGNISGSASASNWKAGTNSRKTASA